MMQTQLVKKAAIIDSGDFNLSANRIEGNKELIKIYENKINARINKVWSDN